MPLVSLLFHDVVGRGELSGFSGPIAEGYKLGVEAFEAHLSDATGEGHPATRIIRTATDASVPGVALTFDDGGVSYYTEIAPRLEARGLRGHCFVTTGEIGRAGFLSKTQIQDLDRRGHVIGSHSVTHPPRFSSCTWAEMTYEWETSCRTLADLLGKAVTVASLPGGYYSRMVGQAAAAAGLRILFTSEPRTTESATNGCLLLGRFSIRRQSRPSRTRALAGGERAALWHERGVWQAKKAVKALTGSTYPQICAWIGSRRPATTLD